LPLAVHLARSTIFCRDRTTIVQIKGVVGYF
jgi:hypothetical protein